MLWGIHRKNRFLTTEFHRPLFIRRRPAAVSGEFRRARFRAFCFLTFVFARQIQHFRDIDSSIDGGSPVFSVRRFLA
jgi:hypothetical protein